MRSKVAIGMAVMLCGLQAEAQSAEDTAAARALFVEARKLAQAGDYEAACPKFEASQRLEPGIGTQFNLADCWERTGRTASAWALFLEVANKTRLAGQTERERVARERAAALEPRLSKLTISVAHAVPGLEVRRADVRLDPAQIGVATPVDPGEQLIEATAPGYEPWSQRVEIAGDGAAETVEVPELKRAPPPQASPPPTTASDSAPLATPTEAPASPTAIRSATPTSTPNAQAEERGRSSVVGYGLLGVGAVGLGLATAFGLRVQSKDDELSRICPRGVDCTRSDLANYSTTRDEAVAARTASYVSFGVGMALVGAGTVLTLHDAATRRTGAVRLRLVGRGLRVEGDW